MKEKNPLVVELIKVLAQSNQAALLENWIPTGKFTLEPKISGGCLIRIQLQSLSNHEVISYTRINDRIVNND